MARNVFLLQWNSFSGLALNAVMQTKQLQDKVDIRLGQFNQFQKGRLMTAIPEQLRLMPMEAGSIDQLLVVGL